MAAYPIGAQRGGSIVTVAICLIGVRHFWKRGDSDLLIVFVTILVLWFIAAAMHKYPIGPCRLGQHAAPVYCLLAGAGGAQLMRQFVSTSRARTAVAALVVLLVAIGIGGMARDVIRPYRDSTARDSRAAVRAILDANDAPILVAQARKNVRVAPVHYYLGASDRVRWIDSDDWGEVVTGEQSLWIVVCSPPSASDERGSFLVSLRQAGGEWVCVEQRSMGVTGKGEPGEPTLRAYLFVRGRE
jgi:hypothetical protein